MGFTGDHQHAGICCFADIGKWEKWALSLLLHEL
jgi:hypothetical protein